jgi:predicted PurR-regulated permease PerM
MASRTALHVIAACAALAALHLARPVLLPLVLAVFCFYALDPLVDRLERARVPRVAGATTAVVLVVALVAGTSLLLWPQFEQVVSQVPSGAQRLREALRDARSGTSGASAVAKVRAAAEALDAVAAGDLGAAITSRGTVRVELADPWRPSAVLWSSGLEAVGAVGQGITVLFLTLFLLIEDDSFKRKLVRRMETLGSKRVTVEILNAIARHIERFIWVQVATSVIVAVVTASVLWALGLSNPALWGGFAGVMNVVPYLGPIVVTAVLAAVGFLQFGTLADAGLVGLAALAITTIEGSVLTPLLLRRAASLNHVAIFVAIAFWSWIWGPIGTLLAVPLLMAAKVVADNVDGLRGWGEFLGD